MADADEFENQRKEAEQKTAKKGKKKGNDDEREALAEIVI